MSHFSLDRPGGTPQNPGDSRVHSQSDLSRGLSTSHVVLPHFASLVALAWPRCGPGRHPKGAPRVNGPGMDGWVPASDFDGSVACRVSPRHLERVGREGQSCGWLWASGASDGGGGGRAASDRTDQGRCNATAAFLNVHRRSVELEDSRSPYRTISTARLRAQVRLSARSDDHPITTPSPLKEMAWQRPRVAPLALAPAVRKVVPTYQRRASAYRVTRNILACGI